jgi:hypothetical protein
MDLIFKVYFSYQQRRGKKKKISDCYIFLGLPQIDIGISRSYKGSIVQVLSRTNLRIRQET